MDNALKEIWNIRKKQMNLTQTKAAKDLGWTQGALSQYINGVTKLSPMALIKLANYLDVEPLQLNPNFTMFSTMTSKLINQQKILVDSLNVIVEETTEQKIKHIAEEAIDQCFGYTEIKPAPTANEQ